MFCGRLSLCKPLPQLYHPIHPLPDAFAQHIIDIEMHFEASKTVVLLNTLMALYSVRPIQTAVEFYEALNDPKYLSYRSRMKVLLARTEVQELLNAEVQGHNEAAAPAPDSPSGIEDQCVETSSPRLSLPDLEKSPTTIQRLSLDCDFEETQKGVSTVLKGVHTDLEAQHSLLSKRLQARKQTKSCVQSPSRAHISDSYNRELESLLERLLLEKFQQTAAIRAQYSSQILEIQSLARKSQNDLLLRVAEEMEKSEAAEVEKLERRLAEKKREELQALHRKWLG